LLDKHQSQKAPLNDNDFLASIWTGFLYTACNITRRWRMPFIRCTRQKGPSAAGAWTG
jgi:hypothetical protein